MQKRDRNNNYFENNMPQFEIKNWNSVTKETITPNKSISSNSTLNNLDVSNLTDTFKQQARVSYKNYY